MNHEKRVAIVGAGPAGSTLALRLVRRGISVTLVEKSSFPREHIGESLSGECALILNDLGLQDVMDRGSFPVKRGVKVHGKGARSAFWVPVSRVDEQGEVVEGQTWQVRRPEFDAALLDAACDAGAELIQAEARDVCRDENGRITGLKLQHADKTLSQLDADFIVDASGLSTFLSRIGIAGTRDRAAYSKQVSFYAQFEGCVRDAVPHDGNTHIFYAEKHQWAWFIPVSETVTSVGVVVPGLCFKQSGMSPEEFLHARLQDLNPDLTRRMTSMNRVSEVWSTSNYSHKVQDFAGPQHICLGDAHRFTDPIFSFGVSNALKEAALAAPVIEDVLGQGDETAQARIADYAKAVTGGQDRVQALIDTFWNFPFVFLKLAHFDRPRDIAELFSGRIYDEASENLETMKIMKKLLRGSSVGLVEAAE